MEVISGLAFTICYPPSNPVVTFLFPPPNQRGIFVIQLPNQVKNVLGHYLHYETKNIFCKMTVLLNSE